LKLLKENEMSQAFKLTRNREISPGCGEDLGQTLARLAAMEMERHIANPNAKVAHWGDGVAQLFHFAADAYEAGASVTIGHNRSDRYIAAAKQHRSMADELINQAKIFRDEVRSARLLAAFDDGYAGRDISRHHFEAREAAIVGKLFAESNEPMPKRINKIYSPRPLGKDSSLDHLLVDDMKFVVIYPDGKIKDGFAKPIA